MPSTEDLLRFMLCHSKLLTENFYLWHLRPQSKANAYKNANFGDKEAFRVQSLQTEYIIIRQAGPQY